MKKLFCAGMLFCALSLSAAGSVAHDAKSSKERESNVLRASYCLPKKDGEEFRQTLREADEENLQAKQEATLGHADLYDLLAAPDFDRKAFLAKAKEVRGLEDQMRENRADAFAAAVAQLTPKERKTLADALEGSPKHKSMHHHRKQAVNDNTNKTPADNTPSATQ
jgi:uncharacterized membrane protein